MMEQKREAPTPRVARIPVKSGAKLVKGSLPTIAEDQPDEEKSVLKKYRAVEAIIRRSYKHGQVER